MILLLKIAICIVSTSGMQRKLGGASNVDLSDSSSSTYQDLLEFSNFALKKVLTGSESNSYNIELVSATQQIVAGMKYTVDATVTQTDCESDCSNLTCQFIIWSQPWIKENPVRILEGSKCE